MPVNNRDIKEIFREVADLLDLKDANQFRVRAYRNAARTISDLSKNVRTMVEEGEDLSKLDGIGDDLAGKIEEIVKTGTLKQLKELEDEVPKELIEIMDIGTLGPKKTKVLYDKLDIESIADLKEAAEEGKIQDLEGFGEKTEENILEEIEHYKNKDGKRYKLSEAEEIIEPLKEYLNEFDGVKELETAGSYRRKKETVGDIDILVTVEEGKKKDLMEYMTEYEDVIDVIAQGTKKTSVRLKSGIQVDLRQVPEEGWGAALIYFTGSKDHNVRLREEGQDKDLKVNEYGIFKGEERIAGKTEKDFYKKFKMEYIEPELREDLGEIKAAHKNKLPNIIGYNDLRGDMHAHTDETDGHLTLKELADAARDKGYSYIGVSDHSQRVSMANGLDEDRLRKQIKEIDKLNKKFKDFRLLKGIEVDILKNGELDLPDDILKELDYTICSVHYNTNMSEEDMTDRVLKAMENPHFNIFGHPTGRRINEREPYDIDIEKIMKAAADKDIYMEINSSPERLDLNDVHCKMAGDLGVGIVIDTDAHTAADLDNIKYGINQARRGWLSKRDVLNTVSAKTLLKRIKRK